MTRFYQIIDSMGTVQYQSNDLPLIIGPGLVSHISVDVDKRIAYIAEVEGHLFIQPADSDAVIFHNDELLSTSLWIKSGDITRLKKQTLQYKISSDRIEIAIKEISEKIDPGSPVDQNNIVPSVRNTELPREIGLNKNIVSTAKNRIYQYLVYSLLIALLFIALYVIMAKSIEIQVHPQADLLKLSGFPAPFKLGKRFLLLPGEYILHAEKTGYKTLNKTIVIKDNEKFLELKLEKLPGKLKLRFIPENEPVKSASQRVILIDGKKYQLKPDQFIELLAGKHIVEIRQEYYKNFKQSINIKGMGLEKILDITLKPNWGIINIKTLPDKADIVLETFDKNKRNLRPVETKFSSPASIKLLAGDYTLKINKEHFKSIEKNISINADEIIDLSSVLLEPADALINLNSTPKNIMVLLNGEYLGTAVKQIRLSSNREQKLTFIAAGYKDKELLVLLEPDEVQYLDINLSEETGSVFVSLSPIHANLYLDGKRQKKNNGRFRISTQQHILEARAKGYKSRTFTITPDKEFSQKLDIVLQREKHKTSKSKAQYLTQAGHKMIFIPAAEFLMGSVKNEIGRRSNERLKKIKITQNYYLSDKEINNSQYRMFKPSHDSGSAASQSLNEKQQPVVNVSWNDAAKYCNWLSLKEGLQPYYKEINGEMTAKNSLADGKSGKGYRLPFESEWSYAARVSQRKKIERFPWSGSYPPLMLSGNFADESAVAYLSSIIKGYNDKYIVSAPVGLFVKNPAGFYDMGGNVSEWCHDFYSTNTALTVGLKNSDQINVDPRGAETGSHHVVRDSSWRDASITELRLAHRSYSLRAQDDIGFRIARYAQ